MRMQAPTLAVDDIAEAADAYPIHLHRAPQEVIDLRSRVRDLEAAYLTISAICDSLQEQRDDAERRLTDARTKLAEMEA